MSEERESPSDADVQRWVSIARKVHDKSPADRNNDRWPIANIAMQAFIMEEQDKFQREMLNQQAELVGYSRKMFYAALAAAVISLLAVMATLMAAKLW